MHIIGFKVLSKIFIKEQSALKTGVLQKYPRESYHIRTALTTNDWLKNSTKYRSNL